MVPDKAGQHYWDNTWRELSLPDRWKIDSNVIRYYVERTLFSWICETLIKYKKIGPNIRLVEVGCARSQILPLLAKRLKVSVTGIDYSPHGCEQAILMLKREGVKGEVHCLDIFSIPDIFIESFDVVFSFGLIEHFSDTKRIVEALAKLLKRDGLIISIIPNMYGTVGFFQKIFNRDIYNIHMKLRPAEIRAAHEAVGLRVIQSQYFISTNYGVINIGIPTKKDLTWWMKKITSAILVRLSMGIWSIENIFGSFPVTRYFSPYVNCVAIRTYSTDW